MDAFFVCFALFHLKYILEITLNVLIEIILISFL